MDPIVMYSAIAAGVVVVCLGVGLAIGIPSAKKKQRELERLSKIAADEDMQIAAINAVAANNATADAVAAIQDVPAAEPAPVQQPAYADVPQQQMPMQQPTMMAPQPQPYDGTMAYQPQGMGGPQQFPRQFPQQRPGFPPQQPYPQQRPMGYGPQMPNNGYAGPGYPQNNGPFPTQPVRGFPSQQQPYPPGVNQGFPGGWPPYRR